MSKEVIQKILDKADVKINGKRNWDIQVKDERLYSRVLSEGSLGLGEAYMDGWWDVKELDQFFDKVLTAELDKDIVTPGLIWNVIKAKMFNPQSKEKSKKVAQEHYDLGNDFYKDMLDKYMQYTCAYFKDTEDLGEAQEKKLDLICKKLQLKKGMTVLELGCGWGGFAKFASEHYGVKVTGYNISKEQVAYAKEQSDNDFRLQDYREAEGKFDRVVSIGMMEHVGSKNYRDFMKLIEGCLKDNGICLVHTIGSRISTKPGTLEPWTDKYIFPGGQLPSIKQIVGAAEGLMDVEDVQNIGVSYDKTLMKWFENFDKNWDKHKDLGERFYRMWKYYLLSCAGSFRSRNIHLWQTVFTKGLRDGVISER